MSWKNKLMIIVGLLILASCEEGPSTATKIKPLLEVAQLTNSPDANTLIIDFRKPEDYNQGHIPGALNIWRNDIEDHSYSIGGMLAQKEDIEALFSQLGISNAHQLILYDDKGLPEAARLWWALKHYGFMDVKLLNGGLQAWEAGGGEMEEEVVHFKPTSFHFPERSSKTRLITKEELYNMISELKKSYVLVDVRSKEEYMGVRQKTGAAKAGRIPGSLHIDWSEAINFEDDKKFKSLSELERIFAGLGKKEDTIIVYCHSGVRSSHTYFVLTELLGFENVWNYDGSWKEWSHTRLPFIDSTNMLVKN